MFMGKSNIAVKQWLRDKQRFADLFNGTVFQGVQIVLPEDLEEIDSESSIIVTDKESKEKGIEKYRDIVMRWKENAEKTERTAGTDGSYKADRFHADH